MRNRGKTGMTLGAVGLCNLQSETLN